jgi:hypothetical protein
LVLASETSNAKPYAIRGRFSHRKSDAIRRKRRFSGLFAVFRYRLDALRAKIPQCSKALSRKIALFDHLNTRQGDRSGGRKIMQLPHRIDSGGMACPFERDRARGADACAGRPQYARDRERIARS